MAIALQLREYSCERVIAILLSVIALLWRKAALFIMAVVNRSYYEKKLKSTTGEQQRKGWIRDARLYDIH